jgi:hypothetical protein
VATTFLAGVAFFAAAGFAAGFAAFLAAVFLAVGFEGLRNGSGYLGTIHLLAGPAQKMQAAQSRWHDSWGQDDCLRKFL